MELGECLFDSHGRSIVATTALTERVAELADEELIRLANLSAQAMQLAGGIAETEPDPYLCLVAACNYELVIRRARKGMS